MNYINTIYINEDIRPQRMYEYCVGKFPNIASRKALKKAIARGELYINNIKAQSGSFVRQGDIVGLIEPKNTITNTIHIDIPVVYEDDFIAIINKPAGIEVSGNKLWTVQNALPHIIKKSSQPDALYVPRPVHRLDYATSGLLIIAKTANAAKILGDMFTNRLITKKYRAIVIGSIPAKGTINNAIDGKEAISQFELISQCNSIKNDTLSLIDLYPHTGRKHQLRRHLADYGYPILGDAMYGKDGYILKGKGMFLCAVLLRFAHPITSEFCEICIDTPHKFSQLLDRENSMFCKKHQIQNTSRIK